MNDMIEVDLPEECVLSSEAQGDIKSFGTSTASNRKRGSDIADFIRRFSYLATRSKLSNCKQKLFYMKKED